MKKTITVNELIERLKIMESIGYGEAQVWFRDYNDMDWELTEGILDCADDYTAVVLG